VELHPLELVLSFILTWSIGLTPPLLIRFKFNKEPMGKWSAIGTCASLWFFNVMLFVVLGSQSKSHGALTLVALVSYWILTKKDKVLSEADRLVSSAESIKVNDDSSDSLTGAAWNGHLSKVKFLLEGGADVNQVNSKGQTALDLARARGDKQLINLLLNHGATQFGGKKSDDEICGLG
jgi:hypothetical protein